jgi:multidrug resistance efflux pump
MKIIPAKLFNYVTTLTVVGVALWAVISLYVRYVENPWTRDGQVRANVVGIAPRVSGPIIQVAVRDNQQVKKGDLLFEIDPEDFQAQVDIAAGQVQNGEASYVQQKQNLDRQTDLYRTHVNALQDFQNAQDSFAAAQAQLASAKANLELAKLNLGYTKVFAPVDGYVTNMNTSPGTYVTAGVQLIALVDTSSYWVAGYFKENSTAPYQGGSKGRHHNDRIREATIRGRSSECWMGNLCSGWIGHYRHGLVAIGQPYDRLGPPPATFSSSHPGFWTNSDSIADWTNCFRRHDALIRAGELGRVRSE